MFVIRDKYQRNIYFPYRCERFVGNNKYYGKSCDIIQSFAMLVGRDNDREI